MIIRSLDYTGDWQFGNGKSSYADTNNAIAENISTRLKSFLNDCFFDMNAGIDWITYLGTPGRQDELNLKIKAVILLSFGVINVVSISTSMNRGKRSFNVSYTINTIYSTSYQQNIEVVNYA